MVPDLLFCAAAAQISPCSEKLGGMQDTGGVAR